MRRVHTLKHMSELYAVAVYVLGALGAIAAAYGLWSIFHYDEWP